MEAFILQFILCVCVCVNKSHDLYFIFLKIDYIYTLYTY